MINVVNTVNTDNTVYTAREDLCAESWAMPLTLKNHA